MRDNMSTLAETAPGLDERSILAEVAEIIVDVVGTEYLGDVEIHRDTEFERDLGFESIDVVVMAEKLKQLYGEQLTLDQWWKTLMEKEVTDVTNLCVGDLIDYIVLCLSAPKTA